MHLVIDSVTIAKLELWLNELLDVHLVTLELAGLLTVDDVVILSQVLVAPSVLEEHGVVLDVEGFDFDVFGQVPDDDAVHGWSLSYSDGHSLFIASGSDLLDEGLQLFFIDVESNPF